MRSIMRIIFLLIITTNIYAKEPTYLKFTNDLLVDKTFYIEEADGYETIVKFYLNNGKLKMFYVIDYKGQLDETNTLSPKISKKGFIEFTVFDRPTEFRLTNITDKEYVIKEYHYHSDKYKNILKWQLVKPANFMRKNWAKKD